MLNILRFYGQIAQVIGLSAMRESGEKNKQKAAEWESEVQSDTETN